MMTSEGQRRIFAPAERGIRKVVISTDIASTSLTINGVVYVVDSGHVKQKSFNPSTGLDALQVVPVSRPEVHQVFALRNAAPHSVIKYPQSLRVHVHQLVEYGSERREAPVPAKLDLG